MAFPAGDIDCIAGADLIELFTKHDAHDRVLSQKDIEIYCKLKNDNINPVSFKRFIRFLREAEQLLAFLKRK